MMTPDQLKNRIETLAPGTKAEVVDLTGYAGSLPGARDFARVREAR